MVRTHAAGFGSKAEGKSNIKLVEGGHLTIKPGIRVRALAIGPAQASSELAHAKASEPTHCVFETMVLEVKPLADAQGGGIVDKLGRGGLRTAILPQQSKIEMAVIRRALSFPVAGGGRPSARKVVQTIPVDSRNPSDQ
jgi:hypothetical protein